MAEGKNRECGRIQRELLAPPEFPGMSEPGGIGIGSRGDEGAASGGNSGMIPTWKGGIWIPGMGLGMLGMVGSEGSRGLSSWS